MHISELSIRKPVFAWMLMTALVVFGIMSFRQMGVSLLPDIDFPIVNVSATLEGASPEVMELNVADPIEDAVTSVQGIKGIASSSKSGNTNITIEFELNKNIDIAVQEIQNAISRIQRRLPKDLDPPVIQKSNPEDNPIMWLAVTSATMPEKDLMALVKNMIKDRFTTVSGVGEVFLGGYVDPNLRVWVSAQKLGKYDLTVQDILSTINLEHSELPSGRIETLDREYNTRTLGEANSAEAFGNILINRRGGSPNYIPIQLKQVAKIEDGLADIRRKSRSNFKPAVGIGIRKQRGFNAVAVADAVKVKLEKVKNELPPGVEMGVRADSTRFIRESVNELSFTLILSALLTAIVCWVFLGSFSATLNIVLAIPTSVLGSFIFLSILGFTLNTFTILGLSLAIGIVVDDAIMVLENIVRHKEMGKTRVVAALEGTREISFAALAATIAIVAIFLPIAFMKGIIGKFLYQFGITLSIAVGLSFLEALTFTPMRCSQFLSTEPRTTFFGKWVEQGFIASAKGYRGVLNVVLNFRFVTVLVSILFFFSSLYFIKSLKKEFVPSQDQNQFLVRIQAPVGSSLEYTNQKFLEVEKYAGSLSSFHQYFGAIGGFGGGDVDTAMLFLTLKPPHERGINPKTEKHWTQTEVMEEVREGLKKIGGFKVFIQDLSLSGFSSKRGFPVEFTIRGSEWGKLVEISKKVMEEMGKSSTMTDIDSDYRSGMPEIQIIPNRDKARERGVSILDLDQTVNALIGGVVAGKFAKEGHRYDIRVRLLPQERQNAASITKLRVRNNRGELVPLSELVTIREQPSLQGISRQDRERAVTITANVKLGSSQEKALEAVREIGGKVIPSEYHLVESGSTQTFRESMRGLVFALVLGLLISYMVLASQFNSFVDPFTVLMALPFSVSGAFIALYLGNQSLNIFSMIGLVLLMGIVKKNSILLVDFTNQVRDRGAGIKEALLEACPTRLRPILMTSVATVAGALPPALSIGPGAESRIPMALAVIGGVIVSTVLTLVVVPCIYSLCAVKRHRTLDAI